ncbi:MAG: molecular chaperone TorD family protein [Chloroflexi bacterium]|nr:molecular chaperone TorD family protein [Chloroflexota bacterium]
MLDATRPGIQIDTGWQEDDAESVSFGEIARFRQGVYRLASASFVRPIVEKFEMLAEAALHLSSESSIASGLTISAASDGFLDMLKVMGSDDVPSLHFEFLRLFGDGPEGPLVPLFEAVYIDPLGMTAGWIIGDLEAAYSAGGVSANNPAAERADHLSVELDFMSHLCGIEAQGWEFESLTEIRRSLNLQSRFLERHARTWIPNVKSSMARQCDGFYAAAIEAAVALIEHDADYASALKMWIKEHHDESVSRV